MKEAVAFVGRNLNYKIVLIDGMKLAELMIEYELGVSRQYTYEVKDWTVIIFGRIKNCYRSFITKGGAIILKKTRKNKEKFTEPLLMCLCAVIFSSVSGSFMEF